jgi:Septum formation
LTEDQPPNPSGLPDQVAVPDPAPAAPSGPEPPEPPVADAPAKQPNRRRTIIVIGVIVAFLAIVLFIVRNNVSADDLKVGDCFNVPNGTSIQTVEKLPCNESHGAEVVHVGEYTGDTYPISLSLDSYIEETCIPAFNAYTGLDINATPDLSMGYFYPTRDGWDSGDRTITCYATQADDSPMTESLKAS